MTKVRIFCLLPLVLLTACASAPPKPIVPDLTGQWVLTTTSQMGEQDADMSVRQTGTQLAGTLSSPQGTMEYAGTLQGDAVQFSFTLDAGGQPLKIDYAGILTGDVIAGKAVFGEFGEGTFTAKRR